MNKKGFTLVELLAVIAILGIIVLITVISVNSTLKETKQSLSQTQIKNIEEAAKTYYINEQISNNNACISISTLIDSGYLNRNVIDPKNKEQITGYVKVSYDSKKYTYKYQKYCGICILTDKDGDGEADTGEVVSCNLSDGIENFYIVENDGTNVEMLTAYILNTSTYRQAEEIQSVDSWFPVTFSSTNYWSSTVTTYPADVYNDINDVIKPIVDNYVTYLKSNLLNATGSLLKEDDLINLGCVASTVEGYEHQYDCSTEWVKSSNYWLATAVSSDTILTMEGGFVDSNGDYYSGLSYFGVRPVITISEDEIKTE